MRKVGVKVGKSPAGNMIRICAFVSHLDLLSASEKETLEGEGRVRSVVGVFEVVV